MSDATAQATEVVFEAHLAQRDKGNAAENINTIYDVNVVLLTSNGVFNGHEGVHQSAKLLSDQLPEMKLTYKTKYVSGEIAFLEWTATSYAGEVLDGVDTFLIRDGKIIVQTIHYTVRKKFYH